MKTRLMMIWMMGALAVSVVAARGADLEGRLVGAIAVEGVNRVPKQMVLNQIRTEVGRPYEQAVVDQDVQNITRLGRFSSVRVEVEGGEEGVLKVVYVVKEQPLISEVQVVGNKSLSDEELLGVVPLHAGDPVDDFLIKSGERLITQKYHDAGYFLVDVQVDEETLSESQVLVYKVREGPRVKVRGVEFEGNEAMSDKELASQIATKNYIFLLQKGQLSDEQMASDVARLMAYYRQRGYLDAQVSRRVQLSDDQKNATVVFLVYEGKQYVVGGMTFVGNTVFSEAQLREAMTLKSGDVFSANKVMDSISSLQDLYGKLGYLPVDPEGGSTTVMIDRVFNNQTGRVDLVVTITEGKRYTVGEVIIRGNELTKDSVVRRDVRGMEPGRPYDLTGLARTQKLLGSSPLFARQEITIQGKPEDDVRDVLIEVEEQRTGSMNFGAAVSSDAGVVGAIDLIQRNFDITDVPESWQEFASGRAFLGGGQYFAISLQPGNEVQQYSVTFQEPHIHDSEYFMDTNLFFYKRVLSDHDEQRTGGSLGLGKRFGDVWSGVVRARYAAIDIGNIDVDAPVDVYDVEGQSILDSLSFSLTRSTVDNRYFPTRGSVTVMSLERTGLLGGDYEFTSLNARYNKFWTVHEDFLGRKTILSLRTEAGYILEDHEAPVFERFYAGGHSTFRGFKYRGVGPRGIQHDTMTLGSDPVGGDFLFLLGAEYNFPVYENFVRLVFFVDSGTVQQDFGFDQYRVSVGSGVRLLLPILGQAPFALDFAYPVMKEEGDDTRVFSFSLDLPF